MVGMRADSPQIRPLFQARAIPLRGSFQAQVVQHRWPQVHGEPADLPNGLVHVGQGLVDLGLLGSRHVGHRM
jgi:hypothetical protein